MVSECVGVIEDFHFSSLHNKIRPLSLFLRPANPWNFSIKINATDVQNTIDHIRKTWIKFSPNFPFEYYFLDETFNQSYKSEEKLQTLFNYFSLLSILISCLGLFGLAAFATEQRTKEIGVRKVLGASVSSILLLLSKEFTKWIIIANIIAWPAAWFYLNSWLDEFAYRIETAWSIFFVAGGIAILIALFTVSIQTLKAALANPIKSLRYE
jgi:putative ABC transport system permease protein